MPATNSTSKTQAAPRARQAQRWTADLCGVNGYTHWCQLEHCERCERPYGLRLDGGLSQQDDPPLLPGVVPGLLLQLPQRVQHLARGFSSGGAQADPGGGSQRSYSSLDTCLLGLLPVPSGRRPPPDSSSLRHSGQALGQSSQSSMLRVQIKMRFTRVQGCCEYGVRLFGMKGMLGGG